MGRRSGVEKRGGVGRRSGVDRRGWGGEWGRGYEVEEERGEVDEVKNRGRRDGEEWHGGNRVGVGGRWIGRVGEMGRRRRRKEEGSG